MALLLLFCLLFLEIPTVSAITAIKANYQLKKNWMGDPCVPKTCVGWVELQQ